jgi:hypothetical protein
MDLTQLTAQYMSNRKFVDKLGITDREILYQSFLRDIEFYNERIAELTNALLNDREGIEPYLTKEVITSFNSYMRACICFFRTKDMNDIHQKEHISVSHLSTKEEKTEEELEEEALQELDRLCGDDIPYSCADTIMMRQIQIKQNTLDRFLKYEKTEVPIILPKQKEIDLEHPDLKKKPFFPPPSPSPSPSPPQEQETPNLSTNENTENIEEIRKVVSSFINDILSQVVDKMENSIPLSSAKKSKKKKEVDPAPTREPSGKKKKKSKPVDTISINI